MTPPADAANPHLGAALAALAARVPPERVDQVWVFPPRQVGAKESGLAVLALYEEGDAGRERRSIVTLRYEAEQLRGGKTQRADQVVEEGSVPLDRGARIIEGVVRRLDAGAESPDVRDVEGRPEEWAALLAGLGTAVVDSASR